MLCLELPGDQDHHSSRVFISSVTDAHAYQPGFAPEKPGSEDMNSPTGYKPRSLITRKLPDQSVNQWKLHHQNMAFPSEAPHLVLDEILF